MKFAVVSCVERNINLEAVCNTRDEAIEKMKECFFEFHRTCGCSEEDIDSMRTLMEFTDDLETDYFGYHIGEDMYAWSNEIEDVYLDISILEIK